ncbi:hypothetical protein BDB01DRAFT_841793 [Pilobolus umbonatus]|nr:hypothetical protein BDB01DRAFT_841793 [Pilobolus umbonatus]
MVKSYQNIEPPARPILPHNDFLIEELAGRQMLPSTPRHIPFKIIDQEKQDPTQFETITELLRYRVLGSKTKILPAFTVVDGKGKESVSVTWEKLGARAEKLARVIQEKSGLQQGDCIALLYTKSEVIEFIIALLGCFLAGMVAVTINATDDLSELWFILRTTSTHLILTTENNLKALTKTMKARNLEFPKNLDWWPTNDFGSLYSNQTKSSYQTQVVGTSLAYIEFTKSMNGELKGVAVSHKTIMNTCQSFISASTETIMFTNEEGVSSVIPNWDLQGPDTILTYLEPRQQLGLHASVLSTIFNGNHTIFASSKIMETPAVWIYVMSKYKATIGFATYPGAFYAAKYYQKNAKEVSNYSKKVTPDLSNLRLLFIDTLVVKPDIDEYIAKNLLTPLGKSMMQPPLQVITPIASLPEHGGIILAFRDYLGPSHSEEFEHIYDEENNTSVSAKKNVYALGVSRDRWECILDADALRQKKVVVLATSNTQPIVNTDPAVVRVGSHGFPFANSSIAIVDPNSGLLCPSDTIGEIWINTLSLSDGFWGLSSLNNEIYHVYPYIVPTETLRAEPVNQKFLRTGLLGTMIGGRLVILGSHEECVRQQRLGEELGIEELHFNFDVINTLSKKNHIENCALFDIIINQQHLPVLIVESNEAKEEIISKAEGAAETALLLHGLRLLVVAVAGKGSLPRYLKDGNQFIHHLMTKRRFLLGQLNVRHLKIDVDRTIFNAQITPRSPSIKPEEIWISVNDYYERAVQLQKIAPHVLSQHTGIEVFNNVIDERSNYDLSKFTNIVDILLWRTAYHADEVAFVGVTSNGTKPYSWKKISNAMATVAYQLDKKMRIKEGAKVLICVPFGIDFVRALYACFVLGIIPVIFSPPDPCQSAHRIQEDIELMTHTLSTLKVSYILVNSQSEDILNNKAVHNAIKVNIANSKLLKKLPDLVNIDKAQRYNKLLGPESGYTVRSHWVSNTDKPSLVIIDQLYQADSPAYVALGHDTIMAQCRSQKLTSQIKYQKPLVVSAVGGLEGLGLLNAAFCGVFVGCPTILLPATEFYNTPQLYFELLARNSCINAYADYSLFDRSMSCINPAEQRKIALKFVRNLMVSTNCRTKPYLYDRISRFLSLSGVERESINTVYSHKFNPMVTTRSYMLLEPLSLLASFEWLQQGIVQPLAPGEESYGVLLHDSGIIPINTMIAIVNPETMALCPNNVIGEIWVASDSNSKGLYDGESIVHADFFEACIQGTDTKKKYMRTGDIGFLWNVQRRSLGAQAPVEEGQCLYVLGKYRELLYCDGLMHFPNDIEESIENCHPDILPEGCYVIQIENEIIAIVAMKPGTSSLATIPVIVTCLLERHSLLIDTVVIVNKSELPKKLNGEKRRNKVRLMYQKNKM